MSDFEMVPDGHGFILSGELDLANAVEFATALQENLRIGGPMTVDMRKQKFMDSSGIQAIVAAASRAPEACIILHGVRDEVQKIVTITGIDRAPNLHIMPCTVGVHPEPA
jgi:anti-anti-sigma factor